MMKINTKFYLFLQNNSGGSFDVNDRVCHRVVIEAENKEQAIDKFKLMIFDQSGSCPCCGDRWSEEYPDDLKETIDLENKNGCEVNIYLDKTKSKAEKKWKIKYGDYNIIEEPTWKKRYSSEHFSGKIHFNSIDEYLQYLANEYGGSTTPDVRIHYLDGTIKEINKIKI